MATTIATLLIDVKANTSGLSRSFKTLGGIVAGLGAAVGVAGAKALDAAADYQSLATGFRVLVGDVGKANEALAELQKFAAVTPFETEEILKSAKALVGFGIAVDDAVDNVKDLAAAAAAGGGDLNKIAVNFAQISAAGKATARDLREFVNQGIPVFDLLADSLGVSVLEIQELQSQGKITGDILADAFAKAAEPTGRFGEALIAQSKTFNGLVSTIKSQFQIVMIRLGETILPAARIAAEKLIGALNGMLDSFQAAAGPGGLLNKIAAGFIAVVDSFGIFIRNIKAGVAPIQGAIQLFLAWSEAQRGNLTLTKAFAEQGIKNLAKPFTNLLNIVDDVNQITGSYTDALTRLDKEASEVPPKLAAVNKELAVTAGSVGKESVQTISTLAQAMGQFKDVIQSIDTLPTLDLIPSSISSTGNGQLGTAGEVGEIGGGVAEQARELAAALNELTPIQQGVIDAGVSGFQQIGFALVDMITLSGGVSESFARMGQALIGIFGDILKELIKVVAKALALATIGNILTGGSFGAFGGILKTLLSGGIPGLADGGLVTSPTVALIGEAGPEVVIPLDKLAKFGGVQTVQVTGRIDGNDIVLLQERGSENRLRRAGF